MPQIEDIERRECKGYIYKNKGGGTTLYKRYRPYIYINCPQCGKSPHWVILSKGKPRYTQCRHCSAVAREKRLLKEGRRLGKENSNWKGGRISTGKRGYMKVRVYPDDFFYSMVKPDGYVFEHRLVMAKHLGRNLHLWEIVHHKNGIKDDNRIENLQLVTDDRHKQITVLEQEIKQLKYTAYINHQAGIKEAVEIAKKAENVYAFQDGKCIPKYEAGFNGYENCRKDILGKLEGLICKD